METSVGFVGDPRGTSEHSTEPRFQIGAVAERTGLSHATLRHWDEIHLVSPSGRTVGGFRLYSEADIQRILVIRRMKPIGFTLDEMQQLLDALTVLRSTNVVAEDRAAVRVSLEAFAQQTQQSVNRIRRHLAYGLEFSELLADLIRAADPE